MAASSIPKGIRSSRCGVDLYYSKNINYIILISPKSPSTFHRMDSHTVGFSVISGEKARPLFIRSPLTEKKEQDWASGGLLRIGTWLDMTNRLRLLVSDILSAIWAVRFACASWLQRHFVRTMRIWSCFLLTERALLSGYIYYATKQRKGKSSIYK